MQVNKIHTLGLRHNFRGSSILLTGTSDKLVLQSWYLGTQYQVEQFRFTDGSVLTNSQAQARVTSGASSVPASAIGSTWASCGGASSGRSVAVSVATTIVRIPPIGSPAAASSAVR